MIFNVGESSRRLTVYPLPHLCSVLRVFKTTQITGKLTETRMWESAPSVPSRSPSVLRSTGIQNSTKLTKLQKNRNWQRCKILYPLPEPSISASLLAWLFKSTLNYTSRGNSKPWSSRISRRWESNHEARGSLTKSFMFRQTTVWRQENSDRWKLPICSYITTGYLISYDIYVF